MSEDLRTAGIGSETWWSSSKNMITDSSLIFSSEMDSDMGNFPCQYLDFDQMQPFTSCNHNNGSMAGTGNCFSGMCFFSTLQMMSFDGSSSPATSPPIWNQSFPDSTENAGVCNSWTQEEIKLSNFSKGLFDPIQQAIFCNNSFADSYKLPSSPCSKSAPFSGPSLPLMELEQPAGVPSTILQGTKAFAGKKSSVSAYEDQMEKTSIESVEDTEGMWDESSPLKRPRLESLTPLPSFKVRKEKQGDRITALQQLVSPFGKTDTASVLHEAIEYIKFLHEQVSVLSAVNVESGPSIQHQQGSEKSKDQEGVGKDLRMRGLRLVPISSTFIVAKGMSQGDFWNQSYGVASR